MKKSKNNHVRRPFRQIPMPRPQAAAECPANGEVTITVYCYDDKELEHHRSIPLDQVKEYRHKHGMVTWINVDGMCRPELVEHICRIFDIHDLTIEDILHIQERPKIDFFEDYIYMALRMMSYQAQEKAISRETVSIVLGRNFVLTFQEPGEDVFDPVRRRLQNTSDRLRQNKADYLAYSLIDMIVDNYFVILEKVGDEIEDLEDEVLENANPALLKNIHSFKREMLFLRKSVWPVREIISSVEQRKPALFRKDTMLYMRDIYDHITQIIETVETYRDILTGILDVYLSSVNNRLSEVVKVLTIISVVFMPLTFLTGFYGMNFSYLPMKDTNWGFAALTGIMGVIVSLMIVYFKKKDWL